MILRIVPSEAESAAGALGTGTIEQASRSFRSDGALIIENVVEGALIAEARRTFGERYSCYLDGSERADALRVGSRRFLITITLEPPFGDPRLFANPYVLQIIGAALDSDFVLGAFGIVCSLTSAPAQHRHRDTAPLFSRDLDRVLPATAITVGIPLLEMNEENGTTELWLGSHHDVGRIEGEGIKPLVREGSCMLWDFRLLHAGTPNRGALPRPLLYLTYCRPWFVEHRNFSKRNPKQKPLLATKTFLANISDQHDYLVARAEEG